MLFLLLFGVYAAWYLQRLIYRKYWNRRLDVHVRFMDSYVYEGDKTTLREEISNAKMLPIPALEVRLVTSRNIEFLGEAGKNANISDQNYQRDIFSLWGRQKVIRTLTADCKRRGYYPIRKSEIVGYDLLYSQSFYQELVQDTSLYVYPRQIDTRRIQLICRAVSGMVLAQHRLHPDPFEFSGIREYQITDPMNHINWKASARSNELMVNQFDSTTNVQTTVILDVEDSGIFRYEELVEESIRIVSSLAAELISRGMELDLISNAPELDMHLKNGAGLLQELNRKLACVDISHISGPISERLQEECAAKRSGHIYILISKNHREDIAEKAGYLSAGGNQVLWVVPVHPWMEYEGVKCSRVDEMQWEVG